MFRKFYILIAILLFFVLTAVVFFTSDFFASKWNSERLQKINLIDTRGNVWNLSKLNNKFGIIYFGYTFCPDLCPNALSILSIALDGIGYDRDSYQPIFISIDPERDTQGVIEEYIQHFDSSLIGITGTKEMLKSFTFNIGANYSIQKKTSLDQDYLVNHTVGYFMINATGQKFSLPIRDNPEDLRKIIISLKNKMLDK
jgi:protein SCO1/2